MWPLSRSVNVNSIQTGTPVQCGHSISHCISLKLNQILSLLSLKPLNVSRWGCCVFLRKATINEKRWILNLFVYIVNGGAYVRDSEQVKLQHAGDGPLNIIPVGGVVAQPVSRVFAHPGEGGTGENHGTVVPKHLSWRPGSEMIA